MIKNTKFILLTFTLVLSMSLIAAAGVAVPYWDNNPLKLAPGEFTTLTLNLQNGVGTNDLTFQATVSQQEGIANLVGDSNEYFVPLKEIVPVELEVAVPEDANPGDRYDITLSFKQVSADDNGFVTIASGFTTKIPVEVVGETESVLYGQEPESSSNNLPIVVIVLVFIALGIIVFVLGKKRRN